MEFQLTWLSVSLLIGAGVAAGFINTLAGGGSLLSLSALMLLGIPADLANGSNRVAVLLQSLEGLRGFNRHGQLVRKAMAPIVVPTLIGALLGALAASFMPVSLLKPVMLATMVGMAVLLVVRPGFVAPSAEERAYSLEEKPAGYGWLFAAGLYGGFIQAGVGFVLITALAGVLRYDLVRANALKLACTASFGVVALAVFALRGEVLWAAGLILALGSVIGASLSVRLAIHASQRVLRWFLLVTVVLACGAIWLG